MLAVDRHRRDAAEIGAPADVALRDGGAEPNRFGDGLRPVRVGNAVLPDDDFRVDARRVDIAQHFGDPADGAPRGGRPSRQFHRHHLARRRAALLSRRDDDVHQHAPIERHDVSHAVLVAIVTADERFVAALQDADDAPLGAPTAVFVDDAALDPDDDPVAVHRLVEERRRNVDVAARLERALGRDESVAGRMRLQAADVEIHLLGQAEAVPANLNQVARGDERLDVAFERGALVARNLEDLKELAHGGGMMNPLAHEGEDLFA